jgi:hypothetical protein
MFGLKSFLGITRKKRKTKTPKTLTKKPVKPRTRPKTLTKKPVKPRPRKKKGKKTKGGTRTLVYSKPTNKPQEPLIHEWALAQHGPQDVQSKRAKKEQKQKKD